MSRTGSRQDQNMVSTDQCVARRLGVVQMDGAGSSCSDLLPARCGGTTSAGRGGPQVKGWILKMSRIQIISRFVRLVGHRVLPVVGQLVSQSAVWAGR